MKLQKLNLDQLEKYRLENPIRILGGNCSMLTNCDSSHCCSDYITDEGNTDPIQ